MTLEEAAGAEAMSLEKGMIVLSTAVAGGPFIGLLGTVWGVMSTFASIAENNSASLTTMAPGVAAALVATVTGLLVAIPGDVRLQLHGDDHPGDHAGTGRVLRRVTRRRSSMCTWTIVRWPRRSSRQTKCWPAGLWMA